MTRGATVTGLEQDAGRVRAVLTDGAAEFDVVVAADGMRSATRALVLESGQVTGYDTGWGGWVGWTDPDDAADRYDECWGAGFFLGTYPVKGRVGVFVGGPRRDTAAGPAAFVGRVRERLRAQDERLGHALEVVAEDRDVHSWPMTDVRTATWSAGRVGLLGDAAAGFLPTAGIGAAMAMESAAVLGWSLAGATAESVPEVLRGFEARQRPRVEAAQQNSRVLARLVFRSSRPVAVARDLASRFMTLDLALAPHPPAAGEPTGGLTRRRAVGRGGVLPSSPGAWRAAEPRRGALSSRSPWFPQPPRGRPPPGGRGGAGSR